MNAKEALSRFVQIAMGPDRARRYAALLETKRGMRKILDDLCHGFEEAIDPRLVTESRASMPMNAPCFTFSGSDDCGTEYATMAEAYDALSTGDSWLIIAQDGQSGIHRPEGRWDVEKMIRIEPCRGTLRR